MHESTHRYPLTCASAGRLRGRPDQRNAEPNCAAQRVQPVAEHSMARAQGLQARDRICRRSCCCTETGRHGSPIEHAVANHSGCDV